MSEGSNGLEIHPLTPERWADFETLLGPRGAVSDCWCMYNRWTNRQMQANPGQARKAAMQAIVDEGRVPGLLAYRDGVPVGWCSVAPRAEFARIEQSKTLGPVDDRPAWAVVCFFIRRRERNQGVARALLHAAVEYAAAHGARLVEAYPADPPSGRMSDVGAYMGVRSLFEAAGFREVARRRPTSHPIMRLETGERADG